MIQFIPTIQPNTGNYYTNQATINSSVAIFKSISSLSRFEDMDISNPITTDLVRHHLIEMGYQPDTLPEDVLNQFVIELTQMYEEGAFDGEPEYEPKEFEFEDNAGHVYSSGNSKIYKSSYDPTKNDYRKTTTKDAWNQDTVDLSSHLQSLNISKIESNQSAHITDRSSTASHSSRSSPVDYSESEFSLLTSSTIPSKARPASGFIRVQQPPRQKKSDPVSNYHAHQAQWSKDKFLGRSKTNRETGRWGGMVTNQPETAARPRHNLASKRSSYGKSH